MAITVAGLVLVSLAVLDSSGRLRDFEFVDSVAQEAARAAGQQLDQAALLQDGEYRIDQGGHVAEKMANAYLDQNYHDQQMSAEVHFKDGRTLEVSVSKTYRTFMLGLSFPVIGHGTATLVHGVTGPENG
ncbi:hypothetical protein [Kitasatospora sp. McL0602]|uniref:hypothetical protein n=1 Tax=Kitasatospora sp. McL0602 TaxID=3439530 RepID=UPI003F8B5F67